MIKHIARFSGKLCLLPVVILLHSYASFAQTQTEFWPEVNGFVKLNDQFRIYMVSALARGKESDVQSLDLAANVDFSLKPLFGKRKKLEDWQRSRWFWVRLGYDYISKQIDGEAGTPENRGMINVFGKTPSLPAEIFLELRTRADLRWIGGDYSTRYRLRLEATREFTVISNSVVPYLNCEAFYDTRYSGWARGTRYGAFLFPAYIPIGARGHRRARNGRRHEGGGSP